MKKTKKSLLIVAIAIAILGLVIVSAGCTGTSSSDGQSSQYQIVTSFGDPTDIFAGTWEGDITTSVSGYSNQQRIYSYTLDFVKDSDTGGQVNVKYSLKDVDKNTGNVVFNWGDYKFDNWCKWTVDKNNIMKASTAGNNKMDFREGSCKVTYNGKNLYVGDMMLPCGTDGKSKSFGASATSSNKYLTAKSSKKPISNYQDVIIGVWYGSQTYVPEDSELGECYDKMVFYRDGSVSYGIYDINNDKEYAKMSDNLSWERSDDGYNFIYDSGGEKGVTKLTIINDNTLATPNGTQFIRDKIPESRNLPTSSSDVVGIWKGTKLLSEYNDRDPVTNIEGKRTIYSAYSFVFKDNGYIDIYERTESKLGSSITIEGNNDMGDYLKWEYVSLGNYNIYSLEDVGVGTFKLSDKKTGVLEFTDADLANNYFKSATLKRYGDVATETKKEASATTFGSVARNQ